MLELSIVLEAQFDDLHGPAAEKGRQHPGRHAVGGINGDLHLLCLRPEELRDMLLVFGGQIAVCDRSGRIALGVKHGHRDMFDVLQAGVGADRLGGLTGDLEAAVLGRML